MKKELATTMMDLWKKGLITGFYVSFGSSFDPSSTKVFGKLEDGTVKDKLIDDLTDLCTDLTYAHLTPVSGYFELYENDNVLYAKGEEMESDYTYNAELMYQIDENYENFTSNFLGSIEFYVPEFWDKEDIEDYNSGDKVIEVCLSINGSPDNFESEVSGISIVNYGSENDEEYDFSDNEDLKQDTLDYFKDVAFGGENSDEANYRVSFELEGRSLSVTEYWDEVIEIGKL